MDSRKKKIVYNYERIYIKIVIIWKRFGKM